MRYLLIPTFVLIAIFLTTSHVQAQEVEVLKVENASAFATSAGQKNGAVFLKLVNHYNETIRLVSVSTDVSDTTELHTMSMEGDMMQMRKVDGFDIAPHDELKLEPSGNHIMLMGLKAPLESGKTFPIRLNFADDKKLNVEVSVVAPGSVPAEGSASDAHSHH
jgi:copper(I)-binding protein